uniref:Remorin C-terminal domain-containing protein n=1 Tax=Ananas comosus var. bracteatus TaxID=296719 RepID=A0A6V7P524_ANACO|nr:unnamed protein product [Ananas comosus var. bracteatus]
MPSLELGLGLGFREAEGDEEEEEEEGRKRKKAEPQHSRSTVGRRRRRRKRAAEEESFDSAIAYSPNTAPATTRCSFECDRDALLHLAGCERSGGPGPDPDPAKRASFSLASRDTPTPQIHTHRASTPLNKGAEEGLVHGAGEEEAGETLDAARNTFSQAPGECHNQRFRSEALPVPGKEPLRRRPASLDLNGQGADASVLSPRFVIGGLGGMSKSSTASSRSRSGTFPSPGTPNYNRHGVAVIGYNKGWSSERVPLPANSSRKYASGGLVLPFNNGRALPSKWEDAEKWIFSPVSGDGIGRSSMPPAHHYRRPKSKSGPLGPPGAIGVAYSTASPLAPKGWGRRWQQQDGGGGRSSSSNGESCIVPSSTLTSSRDATQDEEVENARKAITISPVILKKDVATQMSPEGSPLSSPKERPPFSNSPIANPIDELESHISKLEVRDVEVDDRVTTVTKWSKKQVTRCSDKRSTNIVEWKKKTLEAKDSCWAVTEKEKTISRSKREEAKITAWENLQKAKAEASVRKLDMKLEKKRSSSMDNSGEASICSKKGTGYA